MKTGTPERLQDSGHMARLYLLDLACELQDANKRDMAQEVKDMADRIKDILSEDA